MQVGVLIQQLRKSSRRSDALIDLKIILQLLSNMALADSSTGRVRLTCTAQLLPVHIVLLRLLPA